VNDILAWVILSVVLGLASPAGVSWGTVGFAVFFSVSFTAFCLTWGTRISDRVVAHVRLACGALTHAAGLTALFGFFIAGVMVGDAQALTERTRNVVSQMVHAVFVPLYFASIGLRYDFLVEFDWFIVTFVTVVSIGAKFLGAWLGAWGTPLSRTDRVSIGIAFTPSGMTGIVVADIALEYGILTAPFFIGIVVSAIASSLLVGPLLSWSTRREESVKPLDFFQWPATQLDLKGETRWEIIEEMCGSIETPGAGRVTTKSITEAVLAREELGGTGVGHQVALPHARMAGLERPILTFGRSFQGVDWDAPDGVPVHLVFLVLTPDLDYGTQLMIMAALSKSLSQADVRERLLRADSERELRAALRGVLEVPERMQTGGT
jgi:mannitol/fructose-specific phosphotransferase system IIA component (Ntr-type)